MAYLLPLVRTAFVVDGSGRIGREA